MHVDTHDTTTAASGPFEEVEEQNIDAVENDLKERWGVSDQRCSSERGSSPWGRVKSVCEYLSIPIPTAVVDSRQQIEDSIRAFVNYLQ